jgi:VIT1/CCC1 family predicted Fe2+/Mn2+ transporter
MAEQKKEGFMKLINDALNYVMELIMIKTSLYVNEGAEIITKIIEKKMMRLIKKIQIKMASFTLLLLGVIFLILALLFFLIENLMWSKTIAFLVMGVIIFIAGYLINM